MPLRNGAMVLAVSAAVLMLSAVGVTASARAAGYQAANLHLVTVEEDAFYNYDYDKGSDLAFPDPASPGHNDWPVTIVFANAASVSKVKNAVSSWLTSAGSTMYAALSDGAGVWEWAGDAGRKQATAYFVGGTLVWRTKVLHIRLYAHNGDRSHNALWGDYVLCTTHYDNNEVNQTAGEPKWYGMSEDAEHEVVAWFTDHGYTASPDSFWLGNVESSSRRGGRAWRPSSGDFTHRWQCNGWASVIAIP